MNKLISILTPTYNRADLLIRLFKSLLNQTSFDFEWMIVDDGSTDETKNLVENFKNEKFNVKYIYKENGGKHTALNIGINEINSKLTFIVDSDDWLDSNAIKTIKQDYEKYKNNSKLAGFSYLRMFPDGKINVETGSKENRIDSYNIVRVLENRIGDMAEVYYTEILKQFPFPEFKDERFLGEDVVWIEIGKKYDLVFINQPIYVSDYLADGLTQNRRKNNIKSSKGCYYRSQIMLSIKLKFKQRIKTILQLIVYGKFNSLSYKEIKKDCKYKGLLTLMYPLGLYLYKKWRTEYELA